MRHWWAVGIVLAVIVIGVVLAYQSAAISSRSGNDAPVYSDRRHDPYGTAALRDLLIERGIHVRTLQSPRLEPSDTGVFIQVLAAEQRPAFSERLHPQTRQLADWIAQGNTVVQFTRAPTELMTRFKIAPATQPASLKEVQHFESIGGLPDKTPADVYLARWLASVSQDASLKSVAGERLLLWSPMVLPEKPTPAWKPLAYLPTGGHAVVAGEYRVGKGRLILVGAPTPALNDTLPQEGDLDFLLAIVGKGPVVLDEWSHGIGHEATVIGFLRDAGLLPVLLQLGFLAALYIWSTSGAPRPAETPPDRQRSSIEQIEALGFLYNRSLPPDVTYDRIKLELQRRLAQVLRCAPGELDSRVKILRPELRERIAALFSRLNAARPAHRERCKSCGYELFLNESGLCPECGTPIPLDVRQRLAHDREVPSSAQPRRFRADALFAEALSASHQLTQEVERERRALR